MSQLLEFANNHPILVAGLITSWLALMAYEIRLKSRGTANVSPTDAVRLINKGAMVIDVRSEKEFASGHIVNARNIRPQDIEGNKKLSKNKSKILLTVCDNGLASAKAASQLRKAGFEQAFSIRGGLSGWLRDNMPVVK
jgi:rhodanese-related sulfurtransferase